MGRRADRDPELLAEGLLGGELEPGAIYLLKGKYLLDRAQLLEEAACGASKARRSLYLSFVHVPSCAGASLELLDASSIRDEGLNVVMGRIMDELSSGGAVFVDSAELLLRSVGDERGYLAVMQSLRRVSRVGRGTLVLASLGGPEELLSDYVMEVGPEELAGRAFRVLRVSSPYSPSKRSAFIIASDGTLVRPSQDLGEEPLDMGELGQVISSLRPGSSVEVQVEVGVPQRAVEAFLEGLVSALKGAGLRASIYPEGARDVGEEAGGLLVLGRREETIDIYVDCPTCRRGFPDYLARVAARGDVVVVFFERPWSAAYYVDGRSLRRLERRIAAASRRPLRSILDSSSMLEAPMCM